MAENQFSEALKLNPFYAKAYTNIGMIYRRRNNYEKAEEYYQRALMLNSDDPQNYLALGILYHNYIKDHKRAIENYQKYLDLGGTDRLQVTNWIKECGGTPQ